MAKAAPRVSYEPGPAFQEIKEEAMLDISPTDSTEFWLIQWPKDQIDVSDFHGKELSLKLCSDGNLGSLESSSGKSYELVSFAAQKPDATVFLPSGSETKPVGKISRRVSLVRYPEPEELAKPSFGSLTPSIKKSADRYWLNLRCFMAGSLFLLPLGFSVEVRIIITDQQRKRQVWSNCIIISVGNCSKKTMSRFTSASKNRSSQGSALSLGQKSAEPTPKHKGKRKDESSPGHSNVSGKASQGSEVGREGSNMASEMPQSSSEKSQKKRKKVKIVE